ncbi:DNA gyrase inhibitor YacG [Hyphococcus flavus]|uniref:DNA gyrase inhibitor YacG n=1 Tax=Hyphococcus flavus TaxID=1866326 RepID=UPI003B75CAC6
MTSASNDNAAQKSAQCPICHKAVNTEYEPFCSKRCADVDLHRWLTGQYAIPSEDDESEGAPVDRGEAN